MISSLVAERVMDTVEAVATAESQYAVVGLIVAMDNTLVVAVESSQIRTDHQLAVVVVDNTT